MRRRCSMKNKLICGGQGAGGQGAFEYVLLVAAAVFFIVALTLIVKQIIR